MDYILGYHVVDSSTLLGLYVSQKSQLASQILV